MRHLNDIPADNRLDNLAWGTQAQNVQDALRNGVHGEAKKTQCPIGHPYSVDNTMILYYPDKTPRGRRCRTCDTRTRRAKIALARDNKLNPQERAAIDKEIHTHG